MYIKYAIPLFLGMPIYGMHFPSTFINFFKNQFLQKERSSKAGHGPTQEKSAHQDKIISFDFSSITNIHTSDSDGYTPLMHAVQAGNNQMAHTLIKMGAVLNTHNKKGGTCLLIATRFNDISLVLLLLQEGADVNDMTPKKITPLMTAAHYGHVKIAKVLLKQKNIDINVQAFNNHSALMIAANNNHTDIVRILLAEPTLRIKSDQEKDNQFFNSWLGNLSSQSCKNLIIDKINKLPEKVFSALYDKNFSKAQLLIQKLHDIQIYNNHGENLLHAIIKNLQGTQNSHTFETGKRVLFLVLSLKSELLWCENKAEITPLELAVSRPMILSFFFDLAYAR